jgi:hypothetical protein
MSESASLRQPDPAQQVGIAGIGAEIVERRVKLDCIDMTASSSCLLQSRERGVLLS